MATFSMLSSSMRIFGLATALIVGAASAWAQESSTNTTNPSRPISLADAIANAVQSNLDIQISRYEPRVFGYALSTALSAYDPTLGLEIRRIHSERPGGVDDFGRGFG